MKKIKKISTILALLAFTLLYSASLAFAAPPAIDSPFGGSNDEDPPSLVGGESDNEDPPSLQGPESDGGAQQDPVVNNGPSGGADNNQNGGGGGGGGSGGGSNGSTSRRNNTNSQTASLNGTDNAVADSQDSQNAAGRGAADSENEPDNLTGTGPELIYLILPTLGLSASYFLYKNKR